MNQQKRGRRGGHLNGGHRTGEAPSHLYDSKSEQRYATYRNVKGSTVAEQRGDTVYKTAYSDRGHMLKKPPAWASDVNILEQAQNNGARWFEITDKSTGKVYRAAIADFWRHGHKRNHHDFGLQRALPLQHWRVRRVGERPIEQLSLFGEPS